MLGLLVPGVLMGASEGGGAVVTPVQLPLTGVGQ